MRILFLVTMMSVLAIADDCSYYLKMGYAQETKAAAAYEERDLLETRKRLKFALSNYTSGFKPCLNTLKEKELLDNIGRVNEILIDKNFRDAISIQKFFRAKK